MIEKPRFLQEAVNNTPKQLGEDGSLTFSDLVKGRREILERLEPDEQNYVRRIFDVRKGIVKGDMTGMNKIAQVDKVKELVDRLRKKPEGRELMGLIFKALPRPEVGSQQPRGNAFVVHGEVNIGESNESGYPEDY